MLEFRKPRLYLETTVPSYYTSRPSADIVLAGHQQITREWWLFRSSGYGIFVSELVWQEASRGDGEASVKRCEAIAAFPVLRTNPLALDLAGEYLKTLPLPANAGADALHLALAVVNGMDYLLTWNCRHIARGSVKRALPGVNDKLGYDTPTICTPEELLYDNPDDMV
ncbi:MAG: type II toxin-antitoxin system VapC family toxin [Candidatus Hydrogenedentes bacterium]|nr:type II toxin-antitoxin system VapC family toxin [Candidatus Hydrogenedentota bacterium]